MFAGDIVAPSNSIRAGVRIEQTDDQAQERGFAATARSDQHRGLSAREREVERLKRGARLPYFLLTPTS